jgi:hypothetical protein
LTYSVDKQRPPRDVAIAAIALKDRRATCAQYGHQRPPFTNPGAKRLTLGNLRRTYLLAQPTQVP